VTGKKCLKAVTIQFLQLGLPYLISYVVVVGVDGGGSEGKGGGG